METFLAAQEENISLLKIGNFDKQEILTFTIVDLALTLNENRHTSQIICDVAAKHLKSLKKLQNTINHEFFTRIHQLINDDKLNLSLMEIFSNAMIPLNLKQWKVKNNFFTELNEKLQLFKETQIINGENNVYSLNNDNCQLLQNKSNNLILGENYYQEIMHLCENENDYLKMVYLHLKILQTIINGELIF